MTLDEAIVKIAALEIDDEHYNILGEETDFAYNLIENGDQFEVYYQEMGLKTYVAKCVPFETALDHLVDGLYKTFSG
jgi:hypothetical protein